jgi:hypothetical protein
MINWRFVAPMLSALALWRSPLFAQPAAPPDIYAPITGTQRVEWIVDGTIGPRSLGVGVIADAWQTAWNTPEEWGRGWSGVGKRYVEREADVTLSNSLEAGLGAIWGEDPRYIRAPRGSIRSRVGYAARTVMLAQRRDGRLAPAWGRYAGNVANNLIENAWLPPSVTTPGQTVLRCAAGFAGRLAGNLFEEFWPDIKRRFIR